MAMVHCRECKKAVSSGAPTCPQCGIAESGKGAKPVPTTKDGVRGFLFLAVVVGGVMFACSDREPSEKTASEPAPVTVMAKKSEASTQAVKPVATEDVALDFDVNSADFRRAYNALVHDLRSDKSSDFLMPALTITQGNEANSFKHFFPDANTYIIGRVSKASGKMNSLMVGVGGSGQDGSTGALKAMIITGLAVRAATGLSSESDVGKVTLALLGDASEQLNDPGKATSARVVGNYEINAAGIPGTGILLSVDRLR